MSETQQDMNAYESSHTDPIEVFQRVPLIRMVWIYLTLDIGLSIPAVITIPIDDQITKLIISGALLVVFLVVGYMIWIRIVECRQRCVCRLKPGMYIFLSKRLVAMDQSIDEPLSEEEQISLHDQANGKLRVRSLGDVVANLFIVAIMVGFIAIDPLRWWIHAGLIMLWVTVIVRWVYLGDAIVPGFNRVRINPEGWFWGEWSRFKKSGRWDDTRVLIKPLTKLAQDRYFVVLGNDDGTIGMIVPKASVELIKRAYMSTPRITALPNDSHLCPAN